MAEKGEVMHKWVLALAASFLVPGCSPGDSEAYPGDLRPVAEGFFTGVFGCQPDLLAETAAEEVVISYPIFEGLFDTPAIRGYAAVREFSAGFCSRWSEPRITVHEALQDRDRVVLVWGYSALPAVSDGDDPVPASRESWGGISFFRFNDAGKVVEELGEESTPGPIGRLSR